MGTMALQVSSFRCILQRQFCYSASATTAATTTTTAAPPTAATATTTTATATTTTTTRARKGPLSTAPDSLSPLANLLVDSLEFSEQEARSASTKVIKLRQSRGVKVCRPSFYRNAYLVISFLQEKGLEKPQIKKLIYSLPVVLTCRIETNLEAKMNYFLEMGASVSDFADILSEQRTILWYALDSTIRPVVEALREIMGSTENVWRILKSSRLKYLLGIRENLVRNVSFLRARAIPIESIQKRILQSPAVFMRRHEVFKDLVAQAEVKWGVSPRSAFYLSAIHVLCSLSERTMESKCRLFESFGWDQSHVVNLFRRNPYCLALGERNIKAKLNLFMNELGYDPDHLVAFHLLLCYSLEKRVMPRYLVFQLLIEKGLIKRNLPFWNALRLPEDKFLGKFVLPFLEAVPDLHDIYVNNIRGAKKEETKKRRSKLFRKNEIKA